LEKLFVDGLRVHGAANYHVYSPKSTLI